MQLFNTPVRKWCLLRILFKKILGFSNMACIKTSLMLNLSMALFFSTGRALPEDIWPRWKKQFGERLKEQAIV